MNRPLIAALAIITVACTQVAGPATTDTEAPGTTRATVTTTTVAAQAMEIQDCRTPPVTFSALCEVYELVQEWHVDRPISDTVLADVALDALSRHTPTETEPRPRTFFCAIPSEDFTDFCNALATMVQESEIAIEPVVDEAVVAMTDLGLGPFTYYIPPEQVGSFRQNGIVGGVGILLDATNSVGSKCARISETCPLQIVFVLDNNPGAEAGLLPGDEIIAIDGAPVEGRGFAASATGIAGDETGQVLITVERDGSALEFEIERAPLTVPTVDASLPFPGVGYLRIPDFESDIPGLVNDALMSLSEFGPDTLVIDLRDNPGGFVATAIEVASLFMDGGVVMESNGPNEQIDYPATDGGLATTERLVVLVNRGTASAAEIVAGALRDERGAILVGQHTFGKDAVQIPFQLRNGGELYLVVARWSTPLGATAGNGGLTPDREVEFPSGASVEELVQTALDAASR